MSEQYPLLYDELSEEDRLSPRFHRRLLMSRARARNQVKGAAAIITRWPEHWTTALHYWWIVVGMLALTSLLTYNFLISSYAIVQPTNKYHPKSNIKPTETIYKPSLPPKVFMHILVDDKEEVDLKNYLPYIEIIANKYKRFKYELTIIANDMNEETKEMSDKENNEYALNMLWVDEKKTLNNISNVSIKYSTLSKYFYNSPLKKYTKYLPYQFVKFLVRAVSIWEKGGIAFDPILLTPQSPNSGYIDKICNILMKCKTEKYKPRSLNISSKQYPSKKVNKIKFKPNNIRDIINALEHESYVEKSYQEPLAEAEAEENLIITLERNQRPTADTIGNKQDKMKPVVSENVQKLDVNEKQPDNSSELNLLPLFLDFLFHNKQTTQLNETTTKREIKDVDNQSKDVSKNFGNKSLQMRNFLSDLVDHNNNKPVIISAKEMSNKSDYETGLTEIIEKEPESLLEVTIDLKGNIIATETACHAFVGNLFSNAIHHDQSENVTDFITKELTIFCTGRFASCVGIDVILL